MANNIKNLLRDRGWTFADLSERSGISEGHLSRISGEKRGLSLENAMAIATAFGVEIGDVTDEFHHEDLEHLPRVSRKTKTASEQNGIPNLLIHAGMGPGGLLSVLANSDGDIYADHADGMWQFPDAVKAGWKNLSKIYAMPVVGDSMSPTLPSGSFVFVDTSHRIPSPEDIYAVDYGDGLMIKRIALLPGTETLRVISDNKIYEPHVLNRSDVSVYGRVVAWFQWRG